MILEQLILPSLFQFNRVITSEEYFMIKLCQNWEQVNVPHHIVDDVVNLLRECKQHDIHIGCDSWWLVLVSWLHDRF